MNAFLGYVLAQIVCFGEYNCTAQPIGDHKIYATKSECEWDKEMVGATYDRLECVEVERKVKASDF